MKAGLFLALGLFAFFSHAEEEKAAVKIDAIVLVIQTTDPTRPLRFTVTRPDKVSFTLGKKDQGSDTLSAEKMAELLTLAQKTFQNCKPGTYTTTNTYTFTLYLQPSDGSP